MKTKTNNHLSELRDFVEHQAAEDAVLPAAERRYQAQLVNDVLDQEKLRPVVFKRLFNDYSKKVASLAHSH
jgi:hypothetical protein